MKKITAVLLTVCILLCFAACGRNTNNDPGPAGQKTEQNAAQVTGQSSGQPAEQGGAQPAEPGNSAAPAGEEQNNGGEAAEPRSESATSADQNGTEETSAGAGASEQSRKTDDGPVRYNNYIGYAAGTYEVVDTSSVNVRSSTDTSKDDNIVGKAYRGEQYEVSGFNGDWARITLSDGRSGWVYMGYMQQVGADQNGSSGSPDRYNKNYNDYSSGTYEVVNTDSVNVRSSIDTSNDGNIIGKAYKGEQYEISTFNGEWAKITLSDGKQGWAYMGYLELVGAGSGE